MFPLKNRQPIQYGFGQPTWYSPHHLGQDYAAGNDELYAPFNGEILNEFWGNQQGNCIWFKPDHDDVIMRFMHLKSYESPVGRVSEGQLIGITDSTGLSTGNHLHLDISKNSIQINNFNNFVDPESFNWGESSKMAGQLYNDSQGNVWISYNNKKYYVEAPQDFTGENIINSDDIPGVVMIKKSDSDTLIQQATAELQTAKDKLIQGSIEKQAMIKALTEENTDLKKTNETCHLLVDEADNEKEKALNKLDKCTVDLKNATQGNTTENKGIVDRFIEFISKLWR